MTECSSRGSRNRESREAGSIPDTAKEKPQEAEVIEAGKGRVHDEGKTIALAVKKGDRGLIGKYSLVHVVGAVTNEFYRVPSITSGHQGKLTDFCYAGGKVLINGWNLTRGGNMTTSANFWNNILHILKQSAVPAPQ